MVTWGAPAWRIARVNRRVSTPPIPIRPCRASQSFRSAAARQFEGSVGDQRTTIPRAAFQPRAETFLVAWEDASASRVQAVELNANAELVARCLADWQGQRVTLLYGAKDREHNQAVVLADYLRARV